MSEKKTAVQEDVAQDAEILSGPENAGRELAETSKEVARHEAMDVAFADRVQMQSNAIELIERRAEMFETLRMAAMRDTWPRQWVAHRDRSGATICIPGSAACRRIGQLFGVQVTNKRPVNAEGNFEPKAYGTSVDDVVEYRGWCNAKAKSTGDEEFDIMAARQTSEKFIGRDGHETDVMLSVGTLLHSKSVRTLAGCSQVPMETLADVWKNDGRKSTDQITKGHGFGSSDERGAAQVAEEGAADKANELGREILSRVGGSVDDARILCIDITSNLPKFKGFDSVRRLTQGWQIENAWKRLKAHKTYGDAAQKSTPSDDDESARATDPATGETV